MNFIKDIRAEAWFLFVGSSLIAFDQGIATGVGTFFIANAILSKLFENG